MTILFSPPLACGFIVCGHLIVTIWLTISHITSTFQEGSRGRKTSKNKCVPSFGFRTEGSAKMGLDRSM